MDTALPATPPEASLDDHILARVEELALEAESQHRPLEVDPYRARLFELFVAAEGAGCVDEDSQPDLTADGLCRRLAERWGMKSAAEESVRGASALPPAQLARMRTLWSIMRMWMEWTYAWRSWPEFHPR